ncbi:MAG: AraC family transcriptional regulator [Myxococcota bacterium]
MKDDPGLLPRTALGAHTVFRSRDVEVAHSRTLSLLGGAHRLEFNRGNGRFDAEMRAFPLSEDVLLFSCAYGGDVDLVVPSLPFTLLQTPIAGTSRVLVENRSIQQDHRRSSLANASAEFRMEFHPETAGVGTAVSAKAIRQTLRALLGADPASPLRFDPVSDLESASGRAVHELVRFVVAQVDRQSPVLAHPIGRAQLSEGLLVQLLFGHRSNYSEQLCRRVPTPAPRHVRNVEEYIEANAHRPLRLRDLVVVSGASARSLQEGFKRFRGTTPMKWLRHVRLTRVHAELLRSDPSATSVAEVAATWGFAPSGRFASVYRRRFGELPSETLRRSSLRQ